ncbi:hypothetical protein Tco_0032005 [Tanacetum coccineum]
MKDDKETDEHEEVDETELKKHLVIVKDDDIVIDAIPLATKPPMIVEYKLLKEGIMAYYQLIRADGSSKRYSSMIRMLQVLLVQKVYAVGLQLLEDLLLAPAGRPFRCVSDIWLLISGDAKVKLKKNSLVIVIADLEVS